jgi:hypothetical protein
MDDTLPIVARLVDQYLASPEQRFLDSMSGEADQSRLHEALRQLIARLLSEDFHRLVQAMYRIDVAEDKFHQAMASPDPADAIAGLVIERLLQKAESRIRYRQQSP